MVSRALSIALVLAACRGGGPEPDGAGSGAANRRAPRDPVDDLDRRVDDAPAPTMDAPLTRPEAPEPPDPGKLIAKLGAIPAWQAVVDRYQLLARRGQRGVIYGRVGPALTVAGPAASDAGAASDARSRTDAGDQPGPDAWLVDDTEGHGALGVRVDLAGRAREGERVAVRGAWALDGERRWYWKVDRVEPLPPAPPSDLQEPPSTVPRHAVGRGPLPPDAVPISQAKPGALVSFQLVGPPPASEGDGWPIGDQPGAPPVALINLPGERATYGGQDMRTPDERWRLARGHTYWVRIGKLRRRGPEQPVLVNARTAPVRAD